MRSRARYTWCPIQPRSGIAPQCGAAEPCGAHRSSLDRARRCGDLERYGDPRQCGAQAQQMDSTPSGQTAPCGAAVRCGAVALCGVAAYRTVNRTRSSKNHKSVVVSPLAGGDNGFFRLKLIAITYAAAFLAATAVSALSRLFFSSCATIVTFGGNSTCL